MQNRRQTAQDDLMHALCAPVMLVLLSGCFPTPNKQLASSVIGTVTQGGKPIEHADVAIDQSSFGSCLKWIGEQLPNSQPLSAGSHLTATFSTENPFLLGTHWAAALPVAATTDAHGHFESVGKTGWGITEYNQGGHNVTVCITLENKLLYIGSVSYWNGSAQKIPTVEIRCDLLNEDVPCVMVDADGTEL